MVEEFETTNPEIRIDKDIVLAGALCHDIGKPGSSQSGGLLPKVA